MAAIQVQRPHQTQSSSSSRSTPRLQSTALVSNLLQASFRVFCRRNIHSLRSPHTLLLHHPCAAKYLWRIDLRVAVLSPLAESLVSYIHPNFVPCSECFLLRLFNAILLLAFRSYHIDRGFCQKSPFPRPPVRFQLASRSIDALMVNST